MDFQVDTATEGLDTQTSHENGGQRGRLTPARQAVLRILRATDKALTHHDIEQQARAEGIQFDRVTLYRALEWLVNKTLANKVAAEDRVWRFSAARGQGEAQAYFHCARCDAVYCLDLTPAAGQAVVLPEGFRPVRTEIMLRGECARAGCA